MSHLHYVTNQLGRFPSWNEDGITSYQGTKIIDLGGSSANDKTDGFVNVH